MKNSSSSSLATFEVCRLAIGSAHQTECGQLEEKRTKWALGSVLSTMCWLQVSWILLIIGSHLHLRLFEKIHAGEQKQLKGQTKHKNYDFQ